MGNEKLKIGMAGCGREIKDNSHSQPKLTRLKIDRRDSENWLKKKKKKKRDRVSKWKKKSKC